MSIEESINKLAEAIDRNTAQQAKTLAFLMENKAPSEKENQPDAPVEKAKATKPTKEVKATPTASSTANTGTEASGNSTQAATGEATAGNETAGAGGEASFPYVTLQEAVLKYVKTDFAGVKALLAEYGVDNAAKLPKEKWEDVYNALVAKFEPAGSLA